MLEFVGIASRWVVLHSFHAHEVVYFRDAEVGKITNITTRIKYRYRDHCKQDGSSETLKPWAVNLDRSPRMLDRHLQFHT